MSTMKLWFKLFCPTHGFFCCLTENKNKGVIIPVYWRKNKQKKQTSLGHFFFFYCVEIGRERQDVELTSGNGLVAYQPL